MYEKILIEDEPEYLAGFMVLSLANNDLVVFCDCGSREKGHIKIIFRNVAAYTVYEEFEHPDLLKKP